MPFTITKVTNWPRVVTLGQADKILAPTPKPEDQGRKVMEEKKLDKETGVEIIHKEDADKQGPVGAEPVDADVNIGNEEGKENG